MSDFLTNLTARSLGVASNLLRPELPSLFESPKEGAPILDGAESLREPEEIHEAHSDVPSVTVNRPRREEHPIHEANHSTISQGEGRAIEPELTRSARQTIVPHEASKPVDVSTRIEHKDQIIIEPTISLVKHFEQQELDVSPRPPESIQPVSKRPDPVKTIREMGTALAPVVPKIEPVSPSPQFKQSSNVTVIPSAPPPSYIRINIGWIEVRAVTQPPASTRSIPTAQSKMTLDDYLRDRNKGRR